LELRPEKPANCCYTTTSVHKSALRIKWDLRNGRSQGWNSFSEEETDLDDSQESGDSDHIHVKQCVPDDHPYLEFHLPKTLPCSYKDNINGLNSETDQEKKNIPKDQSSRLMEGYLKMYTSSNSSQDEEEEEDGWIESMMISSPSL